jgi:hypothetical protein
LETLFADLAHSLRLLRRTPVFTVTVIAALAVGIGANAAIFSVVNAVLLKPVPFPDPDRLVTFVSTGPQGEFPGGSPAKFVHWRQQTEIVQDVTAYRTNVVNETSGAEPEQLRAAQVSVDYFCLFGVKASDALAFVSVPAVLLLVAVMAVWWPARCASRVNPIIALRHE